MEKKLGLALAGGGIKAYAQIGFFRHLTEKDIKIDCISGTSMGSVIAGLIAAGANAQQLEEYMLEMEGDFIEKKVFLRPNLNILPFSKNKMNGLVDADTFEGMIQKQFDKLSVYKLSDLKMPCAITSVDLVSSKLVVFTNVPEYFNDPDKIIISDAFVAHAIRSSCSFPIAFSTKKYDEMQLVDGGVKMNLPVSLLKTMKADKVISVTMEGDTSYQASNKIGDVAFRIIDLMIRDKTINEKFLSDYNLNVDVSKYNTFDAGSGKIIMEIGYARSKEEWNSLVKVRDMLT